MTSSTKTASSIKSTSSLAAISASGAPALATQSFPVADYDLDATLSSGQAFRWEKREGAWEGVVQGRWTELRPAQAAIVARAANPNENWDWLTDYLQLEVDLTTVLAEFPTDPAMQVAVRACRGLRLLRQDPWECLASFILSSTKQIVQIQQIVRILCERFGDPVPVGDGALARFSFPSAARIATVSEAELRACKMGFRAPYLKNSAAALASGQLDLEQLRSCDLEKARAQLLQLPGVGRKIADCVLLFAYGFQGAFPVDVWVKKALQELYFPKRAVPDRRLQGFSCRYFGRYAGYAQQYLFHYMRTRRQTGAASDAHS